MKKYTDFTNSEEVAYIIFKLYIYENEKKIFSGNRFFRLKYFYFML